MEEREILEKLVEARRAGDTRKVEVLTELYKRKTPQAAAQPASAPRRSFVQDIPVPPPTPGYVEPVPQPEDTFLGVSPETWGRAGQNAMAGAAAVPPLAAAARGMQMLATGTRAAPYATQVGRALIPTTGSLLAREGVIGAGAGVGAGLLGDAAADRYPGSESARSVGEFFGGLGGALGANTLLSGSKLALDVASNAPKFIKDRLFGDQVSNAVGTSAGRQQVERAYNSNPNFAADMQRAAEIEANTGVSLPMSAAAGDDPTIKSMMAKITSRGENEAFVAEMNKQEMAAKQQLADARKKLALDPKSAANIAAVKAAQDNAKQAAERTAVATKQAKREQVISNIDDRIADLSNNLMNAGQDKTKSGEAIVNLVSARQKAARAEFDPIYEKVVADGEAAGDVMPSENLKAIDDWINDKRRADIFGTMPKLMQVVDRVLAGKKNAQMDDTFANFPIEGRQVVAPKNSYVLKPEEAKSLKEAVNKALRDTTEGSSERRLLVELKDRVNAGLDNMGNFGAALKETDALYRAKVGEPFLDANGVVSVNRANAVEKTFPLLTTPSTLADIKAAVGDSPGFTEIVRDAWLWKLGSTRSIVKENGVDVKQLNRFLRDNKSAIDQIPGLEEQLRAVGGRADALQSTRARILERQRAAGLEAFDKQARQNPTMWQEINSTNGGLVGYVEKALRTPDDMSKLIQQAGSSQEAHASLRSAALESAFSKPDKLKFFDEHKEAFDSLFGSGYSNKVRYLLEASQRLQSYPFIARPNPSLTAGTKFQQETGMPASQLFTTLRNPFGSAWYAGSTIISKFTQNKAGQAEQAEIMNFLKNRKAVGDAAAALKAVEDELKATGKLGRKAAEYGAQMMKNAATAGIFGGIAGYGLGKADLLEEAPQRVYVEPEANMEE